VERVIEVYDYGVADSLPFYTMELLDGKVCVRSRRFRLQRRASTCTMSPPRWRCCTPGACYTATCRRAMSA
jgi:hypothetical protein